MSHYDVLIVGAGQSGLATAHSLRQRGLTAAILEASDDTAGSRSASSPLTTSSMCAPARRSPATVWWCPAPRQSMP
ncbi:FAD-dependent oxidoreductase, partial [Gordonia sp. IITR100]|uniref:FAD-dependent oxidoreductase n=1 Tax=Gordonia sp. IITR100 TaxID=1314686 RepID=UPI0020CA8CBA